MRLAAKRIQFALVSARGRVPVVTYATWRTASTSVHHAIRASSRDASVKAHSLHRANIVEQRGSASPAAARPRAHVGDLAVSRYILARNRRVDWVVLVRDPLAMAMSSAAIAVHRPRCAGDASHRLDEAIARAPIGGLDWWLEQDMRPALGWSVLDEPFDRERGWMETECPQGRMLVMRADVPDAAKSETLSRFLGTRVHVIPKNDSRSGGRGVALAAIATRLAAHPEVIAASLLQRSSRHFWHEDQLVALRAQWISPS